MHALPVDWAPPGESTRMVTGLGLGNAGKVLLFVGGW